MSKEYKISHVSDFLKIPDDKISTCLDEFRTAIEIALATASLCNSLEDIICPEMNPEDRTRILLPEFIWVDDGEKKVTIQFNAEEADK